MIENNDNFFYFDFLKNSKKFRYLNRHQENDLYKFLVVPNPNKRSIKEKYEFGGENSTIAGELGDKMEQVVRHLYNVDDRIGKGIAYNGKAVNNKYPKYYNWAYKNTLGKVTPQSNRIDYLRELKLYAPICIELLNSIRDTRNGQRHVEESIENISKQVVDQTLKDFHDVLAYFYNYYEKSEFPEPYFNPRMQLKASIGDLRGTKKQKRKTPLEYKYNPAWHGKKEEAIEEKAQSVIPEKPIEAGGVSGKEKTSTDDSEQKHPGEGVKDKKDTEPASANKEKSKSVVDSTKDTLKKTDPKKTWTYVKVVIGVGVALLILSGVVSTVSGMVHTLFPGNNEADTEEINDDSNSETSTSTSSSKSTSKEKFNPAVFQYSLEGYKATIYKNGKETKDVGEPRFSKGYGEESYIVASNLSNHVVVVSRNSRAQELAKDKKLFEQTYKKQKSSGAAKYLYNADTNEITLKLHDISYNINNSNYINVDKNLKLSEKGKQKLQNAFDNPRNDNKGLIIDKTNNEKVTLTNEDFINADDANYRVVYDLHFKLDTTYVS